MIKFSSFLFSFAELIFIKVSLYNLPLREPETEYHLQKLLYHLEFFQFQAFPQINDY